MKKSTSILAMSGMLLLSAGIFGYVYQAFHPNLQDSREIARSMLSDEDKESAQKRLASQICINKVKSMFLPGTSVVSNMSFDEEHVEGDQVTIAKDLLVLGHGSAGVAKMLCVHEINTMKTNIQYQYPKDLIKITNK